MPVPVKAACLLALVAVGAVSGVGALRHLPLFALGTLLASSRRDLVRLARRLDAARHCAAVWVLLAAATVAALTARWSVRGLGLGGGAGAVAGAAASGLVILGAVAAVAAVAAIVLALHWPAGRRGSEHPVAQWLGTRSFSLHLVHHPVLVTTAYAVAGRVPVAAAAVLGAGVALPLTEVFFRLVERPSHALARRAGRALAPAGPRMALRLERDDRAA